MSVSLITGALWAISLLRNHAKGDVSRTDPFQLINKVQTECEYESITVGTKIADAYNSMPEDRRNSDRLGHPYVKEHLGFIGDVRNSVVQKHLAEQTPGEGAHASNKKKSKWVDQKHYSSSPYGVLENQWIYMIGDSTMRQLWSTFTTPFLHNDFERNTHDWINNKCEKQFPPRKQHAGHQVVDTSDTGIHNHNHGNPHQHVFSDEKLSTADDERHELTCHIAGYGGAGIVSFDWKRFPYERHDEWLWSESGLWGNQTLTHQHHEHRGVSSAASTAIAAAEGENEHAHREHNASAHYAFQLHQMHHLQQLHGKPDYLILQVGLYSCLHERTHDGLMADHENELNKLFDAIKRAVARPNPPPDSSTSRTNSDSYDKTHHRNEPTTVIIVTSSKAEVATNWCIYHWNRVVSNAAHVRGFVVFDREELEHRLLFKSEHSAGAGFAETPVDLVGGPEVTTTGSLVAMALGKHRTNEQIAAMRSSDFVLASPGPQVVATALLNLMSCLQRNGTVVSAARGDDAFGYYGTQYPWPPPKP